jgi:hypothetical protein
MAMPMKLGKNQERAVEEAYRIARLRREHRAKQDGNPRRLGEQGEDRTPVERSRESIGG